jgi:hypothetical protein
MLWVHEVCKTKSLRGEQDSLPFTSMSECPTCGRVSQQPPVVEGTGKVDYVEVLKGMAVPGAAGFIAAVFGGPAFGAAVATALELRLGMQQSSEQSELAEALHAARAELEQLRAENQRLIAVNDPLRAAAPSQATQPPTFAEPVRILQAERVEKTAAYPAGMAPHEVEARMLLEVDRRSRLIRAQNATEIQDKTNTTPPKDARKKRAPESDPDAE